MLKRWWGAFLLTMMIVIWLPAAMAQADEGHRVLALLLMKPNAAEVSLAVVRAQIGSFDGQIVHMFPGQALIVKVPEGNLARLTALPIVAGFYTQPVDPTTVELKLQSIVTVWNNLIAPSAVLSNDNYLTDDHLQELQDDAFEAPDLPVGHSYLRVNSDSTPGYFQTSEFLAGSVAVGIILVESDGSVDASLEDWTVEEKQQVFSEVVAGLNWWAELESAANLSFVYDDHFTNPLPTGLEPISRPYTDQQTWISEAMGTLGYTQPFYFTQVRDYNVALRETYGTDWAFTIFIVDSSADADNRFSDGYFAYAYRGGPFMVLTSGNNGYGPDNLDVGVAHEMGHIFGALDQYASAHRACTDRAGYLDIENQNSKYGNCAANVESIMRGQIQPYTQRALDPYAAGQIGWRDSDGDGIFDPLDTALPISIDALSQDNDIVIVQGAAEIVPYPSPSRDSVTINRMVGVQYRLDGGAWQPVQATDGAFDGLAEGYTFTTAPLAPGRHLLEVAAVDSAGNLSEPVAATELGVFDPVDGGLFSELDPVNGEFNAGQDTVVIEGLAYQLEDKAIVGVEYRLNGGNWQQAVAVDGAFDSPEEAFNLSVLLQEAGTYLVEARAIDVDSRVESELASQQFEVNPTTTPVEAAYRIFIPLVVTR